jgi:hypothetical protein
LKPARKGEREGKHGTLTLLLDWRLGTLARMVDNENSSRDLLEKSHRFRTQIALVLILVAATLLRIPALPWGIPDKSHNWPYLSDEGNTVRVFENMNPSRGDFDPRYFIWGSLYVYMGGVALKAASMCGAVALVPDRSFYETHPEDFGRIFLVLRCLTLLAALGGIALLFHLGRILYGRVEGILAATLIAVSTGHMALSTVATPHLLANSLCMATALSAWYLRTRPGMTGYLWSGLFLGLATGTVYDSALLAVPVLVVHLMIRPRRLICREDGRMLACAVVSAFTFVATTPYLFLSREAAGSIEHILAHVGSQVPSLARFFNYLGYAVSEPLAWFSLAALLLAVRRRKPEDLFLLAWILPYALVIWRSGPAFMRREIAIIPPLLLLVARTIAALPPRIRAAAIATALASASIPTFAYLDAFRVPDVRSEARTWVEENIPPGESIAVWDWHLGPHLDVKRNPVALLTRGDGDTAAWIVATAHELPLEEALRRWPTADVAKRFRREPRFGPFHFSLAGAPEDWLYPIPDIYILRVPAAARVESDPMGSS